MFSENNEMNWRFMRNIYGTKIVDFELANMKMYENSKRNSSYLMQRKILRSEYCVDNDISKISCHWTD